MNQELAEAIQTLSAKQIALSTFLRTPLTDENADVLGPAMEAAQIELDLVEAIISQLLNGAPLNFPSAAELQRIRQLSAVVAAGVQAVGTFVALVGAVDQLIQAWPSL